MPKTTTNQPRISVTNPLYASAIAQPNVLKRNQACHQCRRRKLKCDAKRPCSTCLRSYNHQLAHPQPGVILPPAPDCTFDEVVESSSTPNEGPRNRYERLENRINELETLLRQKESTNSNPSGSPPHEGHSMSASNALIPMSGFVNTHDSDAASSSSFARSPGRYTGSAVLNMADHSGTSSGLDLIWPNWPIDLPNPELLRHLVDVFFTFHPHANRLFHAPSFIQSLSLPVNHPKFPAPPVLHAICAIGSLYTAAVTSPPPPNYNEVAPDEIFMEKYRLKEQRADSFAEQQAKLAKDTAERMNSLGQDLFQVMQANIILSWFYWSHGRWVDIFLSAAYCMRLSVPLGLNMCPPFHSISKTVRPPSILPPARTVIEDEMRRNAFWLAYATERHHGSGNGWALSLDDQDISQLMPVRGDQFEQGTLVRPNERQWAQSMDLLLQHPEEQTDSFILYIKGTIMLSRVKAFNSRFRSKYFAKDPSVMTIYSENTSLSGEGVDPRGSAAFIELEHITSSFASSFPRHLRNPIINNVVDNHLYTACLMPHIATIILHDPHADVQQSGCISALKILTAARAILDLIYNVWTTSFDISLLDTFCSFCWFSAGRVLVRFLQASIEAKSAEQIETLRNEIDFIHSAIGKMGQRIPLAHRFARMLEDHIIKQCGFAPAKPITLPFPRPKDDDLFPSFFDLSSGFDGSTNLHESLQGQGSFISLA